MVTDSGGPGRFRGGLGAVRRLRLETDTFVTGCADRHEVPPWGIAGGHPGIANRFTVTRNGVEQSLNSLFQLLSPSKFTNVPLKHGDVFSTWQGGGGGYGDPLERDPERVRVDVQNGYVSRDAAERDYGMVFDQRGNVDADATAGRRRLSLEATAKRGSP